MDPRLGPIEGLLDVTTNLFTRALSGVGREAFVARPSGTTNSLAWIAGHVAQSRVRLLALLGDAREIPWEDLVGPAGPPADPACYPGVDEILTEWKSVSEALRRRLRELDEEVLSGPPAMRVPSTDGTLRGAVAFAAYHEAYHVGQMGFLRRWHGLSPLVERR